MQFKQDTSVFTADGRDVGRVDRVVLNPQTKQATHIVVRKGFLFTEDKIVPVSLISAATKDRVTLRPDAGDLDTLPPFEETHYIPLNEAEARSAEYLAGQAYPLYWYPPVGGWMGYDFPLPYIEETQQNIPHNTIAVKDGAHVIAADDQRVGTIEQVFTDSATNRVTGFLISRGLIMKEKRFVPIHWVEHVTEDEVYLSVGAATLEGLREYQES
ncbi:MAG: PRC-barrel domain-containing protein [Anaerolineae bacterium]|nr:PRC-barrel domain-containing protein [Anaerolineae bacterium]